MDFKERLKKLREEKGYSQVELGKLCNVSGPSICSWETGTKNPTKNNVLQLARVLGVSYEELIAEGSTPASSVTD